VYSLHKLSCKAGLLEVNRHAPAVYLFDIFKPFLAQLTNMAGTSQITCSCHVKLLIKKAN